MPKNHKPSGTVNACRIGSELIDEPPDCFAGKFRPI
jgi:hypothetical protein